MHLDQIRLRCSHYSHSREILSFDFGNRTTACAKSLDKGQLIVLTALRSPEVGRSTRSGRAETGVVGYPFDFAQAVQAIAVTLTIV